MDSSRRLGAKEPDQRRARSASPRNVTNVCIHPKSFTLNRPRTPPSRHDVDADPEVAHLHRGAAPGLSRHQVELGYGHRRRAGVVPTLAERYSGRTWASSELTNCHFDWSSLITTFLTVSWCQGNFQVGNSENRDRPNPTRIVLGCVMRSKRFGVEPGRCGFRWPNWSSEARCRFKVHEFLPKKRNTHARMRPYPLPLNYNQPSASNPQPQTLNPQPKPSTLNTGQVQGGGHPGKPDDHRGNDHFGVCSTYAVTPLLLLLHFCFCSTSGFTRALFPCAPTPHTPCWTGER